MTTVLEDHGVMVTADGHVLTADELANLARVAREREGRWSELADAYGPTIGAIRRVRPIRPISPMGPVPLERLRKVAAQMAPLAGWSRTEIVARALLELAVESGSDLQGATRAITVGLRQGRGSDRRTP